MAQLSGGALAVKDQQCIFTGGQLSGHLVKRAVGNVDSPGDVALVVFGAFRPGIDDHDALFHGHSDVLHDKIDINSVMEHKVLLILNFFSFKFNSYYSL